METNAKKITKKEYYNCILDILDYFNDERDFNFGEITIDALANFINHEIELLNSKAEAAQKRAEQKKKEVDVLRERIYEVLNDEKYMTINDIVNAINDPDVSAQMITSRLGQLKKANLVEKDHISVTSTESGKTKRLSAYRKKAESEN